MPSGAHVPAVTGWTRSIEFAGRCVIVVALVLIMAATGRPMLEEFDRLETIGGIGLIALGLVQLTVAGLILTQGGALVPDLLVVVAAAGALVLILAGQPPGPWQPGWWPTSAVHTVQLYVLAYGGRYRWVLGGAAVVVYAALRLVATVRSGDPVALGLTEVVVGVELSLMLVLAVLATRRIAANHDRAEAERAAALAAEDAQQQEERCAREINRFLHDEVIHSLRAIALPRDRVSAVDARDAAARTAARLRADGPGQGAPDSTEVGVLLAAVAAELGLRASVHGRLAGVRDDVAEALELAGTEALRNVARHADTDRVRIRLTGRRNRVVVLIADDGRGFDTAKSGSGLRESIQGRMAEVGGHSAVDSGPGGTTVELRWAPPDVEPCIGGAWADLTRALIPIVWPGIATLVLMSLLLLPAIANPLLLLSGVAVVTVVGVLAGRRRDRLPPAALPILLAAALIGVVTNYLAVSPSTGNGYHLMMAGGVAPLLILAAIHYPLHWSLPGLLLVWGSVIGLGIWRFGLDTMTGPLAGALTGPAMVLSVILLKVVLRPVARWTFTTQDATRHSRLRITDSAQRSLDDDDRLKRTRDRVLPFLMAVADGRLDPGDPDTAARATGLEAAVREEMRWRSTPQAVARAADRARALGWQLELRLTEEQLARTAEPVVGLLEALGRPGGSGTAVLSAFGGLTVVVQAPSREALERWRKRDDLWVREAEEWCRLVVQIPELVDVPEKEDWSEPEEERRVRV